MRAFGSKPLSHLSRRFFAARSPNASSLAPVQCQAQAANHTEDAARVSSSTRASTSAYIHIPFCQRRCHYCDFAIQTVGRRPDEKPHVLAGMDSYVRALCAEIEATAAQGKEPLETIYFGGGTPSLLPPDLLAQVLGSVRARFGIAQGAEVTLEADPGTFDAARLEKYLGLGINRFSVGVQSFQQRHLDTAGRAHSLAQVEEAIRTVGRSGVPSWSLDLISGLPNLTEAEWDESLRRVADSGAPHVSIYDLQVEEGTPFARWYKAGEAPLPDDDVASAMYRRAAEVLGKAGFEHYEVSNYAKAGHRSRHNTAYWASVPFYGFGMGAASYLSGRRFSRPKGMEEYKAWALGFAAESTGGKEGAGVPGYSSMPAETPEDLLLDEVMLRLRTADGLDLDALASRYGAKTAQSVVSSLRPFEAGGLVQFLPGPPAHGRVRLTDPAGFLMSNSVISSVFAVLD